MPDPRAASPRTPMRRRLVGLYALTLMERTGAIHGYALSDGISRRTHGTWRPGPGAVYPSLRRLVEHGLARGRPSGRRRVYSITPAGRRLLARLRRDRAVGHRPAPDLSALWAEVLGAADTPTFLLDRLRTTLLSLEAETKRADLSRPAAGRFAAEVRTELARALARWPDRPAVRRAPSARGEA